MVPTTTRMDIAVLLRRAEEDSAVGRTVGRDRLPHNAKKGENPGIVG
jgi:hypothetical protein